MQTLQFDSKILGRAQPVTVIPPPRLTASGRCYTLFLLHGMSGDHASWVNGSRIADYLADLPILAVMPSVDDSFYLNSELGSYEDFLVQELVPFADAYYPTLANAEGRATTGLSMGGYGALLLALRHPDIFGAAASHSGAVLTARATTELGRPWEWSKTLYGEGLDGARKRREHDILTRAQRFLREDTDTARLRYDGPALYLDCGTEDFLYYASRELTQALRMVGVPYEYHEYPGDHDWGYWDSHVQDSLRFHCRRWGITP